MMIISEIEKIDSLLDQKIRQVQMLLQKKKSLDYSLINNDLVYLYNEMLTLSYALKLWLLNGLVTAMDDPKEFLTTARIQFEILLSLFNHKEIIEHEPASTHRQIHRYRRLDRAM